MKLHKESGWWVPDFFPTGPGSYIGRSKSIEHALSLVPIKHRTVIQAGGHVGVWPKTLAGIFDKVVTFEPMPQNWECLEKNLEGTGVQAFKLALGSSSGFAELNYRDNSSGGHHIATNLKQPHLTVRMGKLDDLVGKHIGTIDALFLDIEGYEIEALVGAHKVLEADHPLLVIENNGCSKKFGYQPEDLEQYLRPYGYRKIGEAGEDIVLVSKFNADSNHEA